MKLLNRGLLRRFGRNRRFDVDIDFLGPAAAEELSTEHEKRDRDSDHENYYDRDDRRATAATTIIVCHKISFFVTNRLSVADRVGRKLKPSRTGIVTRLRLGKQALSNLL